MGKNVVSGTSRVAIEAAESVIVKGGALAAVVAGAFAAAAAHESVLLGPVQVLVGGGGAGLFAWDGRVRQPGKGVARPRGFQRGDEIPDTARVGAPTFAAAMMAVLAHAATLTLAQAVAPAIVLCGRKSPRGDVLARVRDRGPRAMTDIATVLVAAGGRLAGGVLTDEDLAAPDVKMKPATIRHAGSIGVVRVPWLDAEGAARRPADGCKIHTIAAADRAGVVAILTVEDHARGVSIPELGLLAPLCAEPVTRGVARVRPGVGLPAVAPMALLALGDRVDAAVGAALSEDPEGALARWLEACAEAHAIPPTSQSVVGVLQGARGVSKVGGE